jgi:hypothetical protein
MNGVWHHAAAGTPARRANHAVRAPQSKLNKNDQLAFPQKQFGFPQEEVPFPQEQMGFPGKQP